MRAGKSATHILEHVQGRLVGPPPPIFGVVIVVGKRRRPVFATYKG